MDPSSMLNSTLVPLSRKACLTPISPSKDSNSTDPIIAQIQLGIHLRDLRLVADLNIVDVAQDLDCSGAKISKVENGKQGIRAADEATASLHRFVGHERCMRGQLEHLVEVVSSTSRAGLRAAAGDRAQPGRVSRAHRYAVKQL
jgi:hypothetical protein